MIVNLREYFELNRITIFGDIIVVLCFDNSSMQMNITDENIEGFRSIVTMYILLYIYFSVLFENY